MSVLRDPVVRYFILPLVAALVLIGLFGFVLGYTSEAKAHESWIFRGMLKSPTGELCCGEGDCGKMVGGRISSAVGGYEVDADFAIEATGKEPVIEHIKEFVPYREAQPSPDGAFWRCKRPDGSRRFFCGSAGELDHRSSSGSISSDQRITGLPASSSV